MEVPKHVQNSNKENDRYDETPAAKTKVKTPVPDAPKPPPVGILDELATQRKDRSANKRRATDNKPQKGIINEAKRTATGHLPNIVAAEPRHQREVIFKPARARGDISEKTYRVGGRNFGRNAGSKVPTLRDVDNAKRLGLLF
eukprot:Protomagalhaensia_wolfi_Nauph_80__1299@NODE_1773_length_1348_cov_9_178762_g1381_i0_p1_GENE_NODE_1773_length_1348_cov_9_178762_g1381_i0NODE_1773_length_1348_cov_9_178762_g1381_i0_p1_ORF_typecomplete_len143_score10_57_NODE_1773_length_1348_cov_9_178762_g1381_i054482